MTPRCPGCGRFGRKRGQTFVDCPCHDARAIAYYTGQADARNGRPRRHDIADVSLIGDAYTRGYNALVRERVL